MFCKHCGKELQDGQAICLNCGFEVKSVAKAHYCSNCGGELQEGQVYCLNCGFSVETTSTKNDNSADDIPVTGFKVLSFLIPLVGLILYIMYGEKKPISAKEYGKWALIGLGVDVAILVLPELLDSMF